MTNRKRAHSGKGILIAVVLGPLCAAAADLPGRALATPAEPVANLPIQAFQHGKVASGAAASIAASKPACCVAATWALHQVGSYLRYTGRDVHTVTMAASAFHIAWT